MTNGTTLEGDVISALEGVSFSLWYYMFPLLVPHADEICYLQDEVQIRQHLSLTFFLYETFSTLEINFQQKLHHKNQFYDAPPPEHIQTIFKTTNTGSGDKTPDVVLKVKLLHKDIYTIGHKLTKRDKLGVHKNIEDSSLKLLTLLIEAAFTRKDIKLKILETARVHTEVLKHLMRTEQELEVIDERTYIRISKDLVEISKMISGWISYIIKNS